MTRGDGMCRQGTVVSSDTPPLGTWIPACELDWPQHGSWIRRGADGLVLLRQGCRMGGDGVGGWRLKSNSSFETWGLAHSPLLHLPTFLGSRQRWRLELSSRLVTSMILNATLQGVIWDPHPNENALKRRLLPHPRALSLLIVERLCLENLGFLNRKIFINEGEKEVRGKATPNRIWRLDEAWDGAGWSLHVLCICCRTVSDVMIGDVSYLGRRLAN